MNQECGKDGAGNAKRYMVLDGPVQADNVEQKPFVQLQAMKKVRYVEFRFMM